MPEGSNPTPWTYGGYLLVKWAIRAIATLLALFFLVLLATPILYALSIEVPKLPRYWEDPVKLALVGLALALVLLLAIKHTIVERMPWQMAVIERLEPLEHHRVRITCSVHFGKQASGDLTFVESVPPSRSHLVTVGGRVVVRRSPDDSLVRVDWDEAAARFDTASKPAPSAGGAPAPRLVTCPRCGADLDIESSASGQLRCAYCRATVDLQPPAGARDGRASKKGDTKDG